VIKRHFFLWFALVGIILAASCIIFVPYPEDQPGLAGDTYYDDYGYSYFYDSLSPYGVWIHHPPYGYVWIPRISRPGWRPYTEGRWVWTDYGWTWISSWDWGWMAFHYGRWNWDAGFGWYWVPDTVWGPAWVTWRWSNLFIGWAPLPPNVRFVSGVGVQSIPAGFPNTYWIFIEYNYFYQPRLSRYVLPPERNLTILSAASLRSNLISRNERIFNQGIPLEEMRRRTGHSIVEYKLRDADRATNTITEGDVLRIYRPTIQQENQAKPRTVVREEEIRERLEQPTIRQKEPVPSPAETTEMKKLQEHEVVLLRESQKKEIDDLNRRTAEARKRTHDSAERAKIDRESQTRIQQLKIKHQEEEAKLKKRQEEEARAKSSKTIKKKKKSP
jgi:hypothetical protein